MNNLITFSLILAGMLLLLLRKGTKRQRRANRRLATTLLLFGLASGGYTYTQQHTSLLGTPPQSSSVSNSVPATDGTSRQPVTQLAQLNYNNTAEITVNNNEPGFTKAELATDEGPWTTFSNLDSLNRAGTANALQLSGENNNPKNLMTGTRQLNSPLMQAHEDDMAHYLKQSRQHFIRYEVTPIFRGDELLPRGVAMRAQSIGDNTIHFNVYIFNVQPGVTLNYADGTSQLN